MVLYSYPRGFSCHQSFILIVLLALPCACSLSFNFTSFSPNNREIIVTGDASFSGSSVLRLTKNERKDDLKFSVGRATYVQPVNLWDAKTQKLTDFTTHFSFIIDALGQNKSGDGMTFFLSPINSSIPLNSEGGYLGLVNTQTPSNSSENQIVAVEFDSYKNPWDPSSDHIGIDVNSVVSVANVSWGSSIKNGIKANAWVTYNSTTHNLSVFLTYANNTVFRGQSNLWHIIDLRTVLPEIVIVGFSASTGSSVELHDVLSWDFNSSLEPTNEVNDNNTVPPSNKVPPPPSKTGPPTRDNNTGLIAGIVVSVVCILLSVWGVMWWRKRKLEMNVDGRG